MKASLNKLFAFFSFKMVDTTEKHSRISPSVGKSSNLIYLVWAIFGGFILHFLLSNYLSVLLKPEFEKPADTFADLIERNITLFHLPGSVRYIKFFENSADPSTQEMSRRIIFAKDIPEYIQWVYDALSKGNLASIGANPVLFKPSDIERNVWYSSTASIPGTFPYKGHQASKKWPLRKVFKPFSICHSYFFI